MKISIKELIFKLEALNVHKFQRYKKWMNMANSVNREVPSKMAEMMAVHRVIESVKPENERICYNHYAVHSSIHKT